MRLRLLLLTVLLLVGMLSAKAQDDGYAEVLRRIEEARRTGATELDLSILSLTTLPDELWELTSLQNLNLQGNRLTHLSPQISQLTSLQRLSVQSNLLTEIPPAIFTLTNLEHLEWGMNGLTEVPPEISQLRNLRWLSLYANDLTELPAEIGQLRELRFLGLDLNDLQPCREKLVNSTIWNISTSPRTNCGVYPPQWVSFGISSISSLSAIYSALHRRQGWLTSATNMTAGKKRSAGWFLPGCPAWGCWQR